VLGLIFIFGASGDKDIVVYELFYELATGIFYASVILPRLRLLTISSVFNFRLFCPF
jgi:hypothetical protein